MLTSLSGVGTKKDWWRLIYQNIILTEQNINTTKKTLTDNVKKVSPETERYRKCLFGYSRIVHRDICTFTLVFSHGKKISCGTRGPVTRVSCTLNIIKAILQVLIYKALYEKSYLGSKTTMTSGEWTCLISFATAPLTCSERGGSEKFKMKIYVSSGIRTHTPPVHDREVAAP